MKQSAAATGLSIRIVTSAVQLLTAAILIGSVWMPHLLWAGIALVILSLFCYLSAPIAYELTGNQLSVISRLGSKTFGRVIKGSLIGDQKLPFSIRLWGNGGLFAGTGIFWNKQYGIFRAYVTTGQRSKLTLIETHDSKVIITPERPAEFIDHLTS